MHRYATSLFLSDIYVLISFSRSANYQNLESQILGLATAYDFCI